MTPTNHATFAGAARGTTQLRVRDLLVRAEAALVRPVDIAWLVAFRVLFGLAMAVSMQRFVAYGWIDSLLVGPKVRFHYWGFGWVEPLSRGGMHVLFYVLVGLALAMSAGLAFRVTAPLFALGLTYVQLIDVSTYLNHYYLAALLAWLLALSPANGAWSVDAWARKERRDHVPMAWLALFRVQVGLVYVFAGLAKLQSDWLVHGQPLGIWLGANTDVPVLGRLFTVSGVPLAMSWFGFLFDTTIVGWLSWRKTRPYAYAVLLVFHVLTRVLFDIGMFPIIMSIAALVFFDPSWARFGRSRPAAWAPARRSPWMRAALVLGGIYCIVQVLLPLRAHLYGGNVLWHEQGMRFSWRVMVRAKGGATTFMVKTAKGRVVHVAPSTYLTAFQENEMSGQPDLVLQLAHRIKADFEARDPGPVEVRAESYASLDGRPASLLIDPEVDLGTVHDGIAPARWIRPAPAEPPPPTRPVR